MAQRILVSLNEGADPFHAPIVFIGDDVVHVHWRELDVTFRRQANEEWVSDFEQRFRAKARELIRALEQL